MGVGEGMDQARTRRARAGQAWAQQAPNNVCSEGGRPGRGEAGRGGVGWGAEVWYTAEIPVEGSPGCLRSHPDSSHR